MKLKFFMFLVTALFLMGCTNTPITEKVTESQFDPQEYFELFKEFSLCSIEDETIRQEIIILTESDEGSTEQLVTKTHQRIIKIDECLSILNTMEGYLDRNYRELEEWDVHPELEKKDILRTQNTYLAIRQELENNVVRSYYSP
ncbi:hypothetical protein GOV03_05080 [Candidatus Woesearchaeota archaeon]|nr:hypothetical protein [Candidatus Woesearchaeota archaeon]